MMNKKLLLFIVPILIVVGVVFRIVISDLVITPDNDFYYIASFSDKAMGGNSQVLSLTQDSTAFRIHYLLEGKYRYPFAGFSINARSEDSTLDVSRYDIITLRIDTTNATGMNVTLPFYMPGVSDRDKVNTWFYRMADIPYDADRESYSFSIHSMGTATWWYSANNYPEDGKYNPDYSQMGSLLFASHDKASFPENISKEYQFGIYEIRFSTDPVKAVLIGTALLILYGAVVLIVLGIRKKRTVISYTPLDIKSSADTMTEQLVAFIGENYHKSSFSIKDIEKETGISGTHIRKTISEQYDSTFREYLTTIRLSEAKRLLTETDRTVSEISFAVGYQHGTTLSKIFRKEVGMTPSEYRNR